VEIELVALVDYSIDIFRRSRRQQAALFNEFRETGMSNKLKYNSVADLRANYPDFFWKTVRPYIGDALRYLRVTQEGQQWIANLYANVFSIEHRGQLF
jgi:hypothetical protein